MRFLPALALVPFVVAAPVVATAQTLTSLPLELISAGAMPTVVNLGPKSAGLTFKSSEAIACTVVYGKTPDFGMITNDPDMSALVTLDHNPVLGKLEPGTEYFFRVQGITKTGKLYASAMQSFTTPKEVQRSDGLVVLDASVMAVSSNYGNGANDSAWGANSAIDGDPSTAWSSNGDGSDAYLELDFGTPVAVEYVDVWTRTMSNNTAKIASLKITTDSGEVFGPFALPDASKPYRFAVKTTAKTLRVDALDSNGGNTGLVEISVLGKPAN